MLKNIVDRQTKEFVEYSREFTYEDGDGGYSFPCDIAGNVLLDNDAARESYAWVMAHPERFAHFNEFTRRTRTYTENAHGTCICGEEVELYDQYRGACQCPKCERWYNLFGQSLIDPKYWEDDGDEY